MAYVRNCACRRVCCIPVFIPVRPQPQPQVYDPPSEGPSTEDLDLYLYGPNDNDATECPCGDF